MKQEKEVTWLIKLYQSKYIKGFFGSNCACIKDFERLLDAPENDRLFRIWINQLKESGILEFSNKIDNRRNGISVDGFVINRDLVLKRLRELDIYSDLVKFFNLRSGGFVPK